jgi:hypothetical protein
MSRIDILLLYYIFIWLTDIHHGSNKITGGTKLYITDMALSYITDIAKGNIWLRSRHVHLSTRTNGQMVRRQRKKTPLDTRTNHKSPGQMVNQREQQHAPEEQNP